MTTVLFRNLAGLLSVLAYLLNTIFWVIPIFFLSLLKLLPIRPWQTLISHLLDGCASFWISVNSVNQNLFSRTQIDVIGDRQLSQKDWYLVISNHRSWVDILVLQRIFNRKIPFLKFFLKKELIWVPFLGIAWWALDFPFMQRYSKAFLEKNPHLKGKDLESTRKACEKFRSKPVSIMNFLEGTRWTPQKHLKQNNQYTHLLSPKAGGMAFVLSAMGDQLHKLLDVTIYYPDGTPTFWDFVCGRLQHVKVQINVMAIADIMNSDTFSMDYFDDPAQRRHFQNWINQLWLNKDQDIEKLASNQILN